MRCRGLASKAKGAQERFYKRICEFRYEMVRSQRCQRVREIWWEHSEEKLTAERDSVRVVVIAVSKRVKVENPGRLLEVAAVRKR